MAETQLDIERNIAGIKKRLKEGVRIIKEGHKIEGINPEGVEMIIPLTPRQIQERLKKLEEQVVALIDGSRKHDYY